MAYHLYNNNIFKTAYIYVLRNSIFHSLVFSVEINFGFAIISLLLITQGWKFELRWICFELIRAAKSHYVCATPALEGEEKEKAPVSLCNLGFYSFFSTDNIFSVERATKPQNNIKFRLHILRDGGC